MDNTMQICDTEITVKEYAGQRVVTFKDIDRVHERPEGTARKRFNDNREHFIEDEDFFKVSPSEFYENIDRPVRARSIMEFADSLDGTRGIDYSGYIFLTKEPESGLIKIGRTRHKVKKIMTTLNVGRTNDLAPYAEFECKDVLKAQQEIHRQLEQHRKKGEWFSVSIKEAEKIIKETIAKVDAAFDPTARHKGGARVPITLITESGYLMLVKSFTDDLAWKVQRELVNCYFRVKEARREPEENAVIKRPLTMDDYTEAARTIAKCHNSRLPLVISLYIRAGLDMSAMREASNLAKEEKQEADADDRDALLMELMDKFTLTQLTEMLNICKSSLYYYKTGKHKPYEKRREYIISVLEKSGDER